MCDFFDYLGWLNLSTVEQWDIVIKGLYLFGAAAAAWWTISRWYIAKKIEIEQDLITNMAESAAYWMAAIRKARKRRDQEAMALGEKYLKDNKIDADLVLKGNLGLKKLRALNRQHLGNARFAGRVDELQKAEKS